MKVTDIVFFGAGASASEGAPLQGELFKKYFSFYKHELNRLPTKKMSSRLTNFFEDFFGINIEDNNLTGASFPTFEEILGLLEFAINRGESLRNYSSTANKPQLQRIREDMIFLIAIILDKELRGEPKHHKILVDRLMNEGIINKTGFISLNYDILIDNSLVDIYENYDLDYGIDFTNFYKKNDWRRPRVHRAINLFKIHGSLNWLYCPTCISLTLTPKEKEVATLAFRAKKCYNCDTEMIPIIIPPTFFKVMSNYYLQELWHKTEKLLGRAKRIFFCGYSFPDADIHIKYLLKRVEINKGFTPEIYIINNHKEKSQYEKASEELRYKRFFRESNRVKYTDLSFEDFCKHGI